MFAKCGEYVERGEFVL